MSDWKVVLLCGENFETGERAVTEGKARWRVISCCDHGTL